MHGHQQVSYFNMGLVKDIDFIEYQDEDSPVLTWKFTKRGKAKYDKFIHFADLWLEWLEKDTANDTLTNLVNPMTMGIYD